MLNAVYYNLKQYLPLHFDSFQIWTNAGMAMEGVLISVSTLEHRMYVNVKKDIDFLQIKEHARVSIVLKF